MTSGPTAAVVGAADAIDVGLDVGTGVGTGVGELDVVGIAVGALVGPAGDAVGAGDASRGGVVAITGVGFGPMVAPCWHAVREARRTTAMTLSLGKRTAFTSLVIGSRTTDLYA